MGHAVSNTSESEVNAVCFAYGPSREAVSVHPHTHFIYDITHSFPIKSDADGRH
jgi:hypothetical protein